MAVNRKKSRTKSDWFSKLTPKAQKAYLKKHKNSKYGKKASTTVSSKKTSKKPKLSGNKNTYIKGFKLAQREERRLGRPLTEREMQKLVRNLK